MESDVDMLDGTIMDSSAGATKEDAHIVLESSLEGSALAIIVSSWSSRSDDKGGGMDGRRSSIASACTVGATVKVLYLDTCCLCHSCSSRVISFLNHQTDILRC